MREAIAFHVDGLREEGQPVPEPGSYSRMSNCLPEQKRLQTSEAFPNSS
jgi:hypothetical protein